MMTQSQSVFSSSSFSNGASQVFNLEEGKLAAELELPIADEEVVHLGYNTALAVSGDAQWVAAVTGNRVDIFSLDSLQVKQEKRFCKKEKRSGVVYDWGGEQNPR